MRRVAEQISLKKAQRKKGEPEQVKQEGVKENLLKRKLGLRSWTGDINATLRGEGSDKASIFNKVEKPEIVDAIRGSGMLSGSFVGASRWPRTADFNKVKKKTLRTDQGPEDILFQDLVAYWAVIKSLLPELNLFCSLMDSNFENTVPTARIKFPSFNLSSALEANHKARMAAEDAGEPLDDGEVEFEDDVDEEVCAEPVPQSIFPTTFPRPPAMTGTKGALPLELEDFDASALPVSSSGWNANPRKKLSPGLQRVWKDLDALSTLSGLKLLRWDG
ncbi:MAG: hypothetical protein NXY57DRAFT_1043350, partial [Lentinula lateritia]